MRRVLTLLLELLAQHVELLLGTLHLLESLLGPLVMLLRLVPKLLVLLARRLVLLLSDRQLLLEVSALLVSLEGRVLRLLLPLDRGAHRRLLLLELALLFAHERPAEHRLVQVDLLLDLLELLGPFIVGLRLACDLLLLAHLLRGTLELLLQVLHVLLRLQQVVLPTLQVGRLQEEAVPVRFVALVQELFRVLLREQRTRVVGLDVEVQAELGKLGVRRAACSAVGAVLELVRARARALEPPFGHDSVTKLVCLPRVLAAVGKVHRNQRVICAVLDQAFGRVRVAPGGARAVAEARNERVYDRRLSRAILADDEVDVRVEVDAQVRVIHEVLKLERAQHAVFEVLDGCAAPRLLGLLGLLGWVRLLLGIVR